MCTGVFLHDPCNIITYLCILSCLFHAPWKQELSHSVYHCTVSVYFITVLSHGRYPISWEVQIWASSLKQPPIPCALKAWDHLSKHKVKVQETGEIRWPDLQSRCGLTHPSSCVQTRWVECTGTVPTKNVGQLASWIFTIRLGAPLHCGKGSEEGGRWLKSLPEVYTLVTHNFKGVKKKHK